MRQNNFIKKLGYFTGALLMVSLAHAENTVTPDIAGVVAKDTPIELIKEGFDGTEGPLGLPDGNLIFTESKANRIVQITPDGKVSSYLENSNGSNGLALGANGKLFSVQQVKPRVGIIYPVGKEKINNPKARTPSVQNNSKVSLSAFYAKHRLRKNL